MSLISSSVESETPTLDMKLNKSNIMARVWSALLSFFLSNFHSRVSTKYWFVLFTRWPLMPPGVFRKYGSSKICYTGKDRSTCDQGICFGVSEVRVPWSTWRSSILHHFWWGLWDNLNQANHIASHTGSQLLPPHKTKVQIGVHTE